MGPGGPQRCRRTAVDHGGRHLGLGGPEPLGDEVARAELDTGEHLDNLARRWTVVGGFDVVPPTALRPPDGVVVGGVWIVAARRERAVNSMDGPFGLMLNVALIAVVVFT